MAEIIIDTNCLSNVFDKESNSFEDFAPLNDWIYSGCGQVIYGGTKYLDEIKKYYGLFKELKKINKAKYIDNLKVDEKEIWVKSQIQHQNFDDQHIVALLIISKCKLICSLDKRAYPYFKHKEFFSKKNKPRIYSSKKNEKLLKP